MYYPEEAKKIEEGYAEFGIIVVNAVSHVFKDIVLPFFIPSFKKTNNPDKDK
jgi:hypothetical protein